MIKITYFKRN